MGVLPKTQFGYNLKGFMITGGPVPIHDKEDKEVRAQIMNVIEKYYSGYIDKSQFALAIEFGKMHQEDKSPYHHFHCVLIARDGHHIKWKKTCCEALKKICEPDGYRQPNVQANHSREQKKGESTFKILTRYLTDPQKVKDVDGNITIGANFGPTREELYQKIFKQPIGTPERAMAIAEYNIYMFDLLRHGEKGIQLN